MERKTFKDWVLEEQELAERQKKELEFNIELEKKVQKENSKHFIRRSNRIAQKRIEKETNEAYNAYLLSLPK